RASPVPFLRFTRDKRGYEHFALVHQTTNRRGKVRTRVLYWYRTPPGVRVGREPFDAAMRRALEAQNPDISFDWRKIVETPIPSAETEHWRERRRAEKAEKAARKAEAAAEAGAEDVVDVPEPDIETDLQTDAQPVVAESADATDAMPREVTLAAPPLDAGQGADQKLDGQARHRRRRRRGRRGQGGTPGAPQPDLPEPHDPD